MAATKGITEVVSNCPYVIESTYYTTLEPGATVTHTHAGPSGVAPLKAECIVTERPTSRDVVSFAWDESANDTTNNTVALQFDTTNGGDLAGAQVKVLIYFLDQASGGIS